MLAHQIESDSLQRPAVDGHEQPSAPPDGPAPQTDKAGAQLSCGLEEREPADNPAPDSQMADGPKLVAPRLDPNEAAPCHQQPRQPQPQPQQQQVEPNHTIADKQPARGVEARLLVRRREAGALIGKRGANIKRLRQLFKESAFNIPDTGNGPERIVCVSTGSLEQLTLILAELTQLFQEKQSSQTARANHLAHLLQSPSCAPERGAARASGELIEVKLLINASHAGLLIGIGGQSIRKLRNDSKAAIKIYEMCCPLSSERVCAIKAKPPVVVSTIKMILEILAVNPIKGTHKPYDALNFDLNLADKYGGYAADDFCLVPSPSVPAQAAAPAPAPLELLHQRHHQADQTFSAPAAFMLQSHASQLMVAAAAAAAAAAASREGPSGDHFESAPTSFARMHKFNRPPDHCDRYATAAAAAMAAQKYHGIIKAGQQAIMAGRFHPYYAMNAHHLRFMEQQQQHQYQQQQHQHRSGPRHGLGDDAAEGLAARQAANGPQHCRLVRSPQTNPRPLTCSCCSSAKCEGAAGAGGGDG